jgi:hypothetical protein
VAPVLVHVSVVDCPGLIVIGFAVSFTLSVEMLVGRTSSSFVWNVSVTEEPVAPLALIPLVSLGVVGDFP